MGAHRFEELDVFQRAYKLSIEIHHVSLIMPKIEQFDLASQIRRASKSICANFGRRLWKAELLQSRVQAVHPGVHWFCR
jgi:hypothetical protein